MPRTVVSLLLFEWLHLHPRPVAQCCNAAAHAPSYVQCCTFHNLRARLLKILDFKLTSRSRCRAAVAVAVAESPPPMRCRRCAFVDLRSCLTLLIAPLTLLRVIVLLLFSLHCYTSPVHYFAVVVSSYTQTSTIPRGSSRRRLTSPSFLGGGEFGKVLYARHGSTRRISYEFPRCRRRSLQF